MVKPLAATALLLTTCAGQTVTPKQNAARTHYFLAKLARSTSAAASTDFAEQPMNSAAMGANRAVSVRLQAQPEATSSNELLDTMRIGQVIEVVVVWIIKTYLSAL